VRGAGDADAGACAEDYRCWALGDYSRRRRPRRLGRTARNGCPTVGEGLIGSGDARGSDLAEPEGARGAEVGAVEGAVDAEGGGEAAGAAG
jgi:hypothetical protein